MPKLITPVQYETAFDGLNEVRPLILSDVIKTELNVPVLNLNPVSKGLPAIGKFLQCNEVGGVIGYSGNIEPAKSYYTIYKPGIYGQVYEESFPARVQYMNFKFTEVSLTFTQGIIASPGGRPVFTIPTLNWTLCPCKHKDVRFVAVGTPGGEYTVLIYGYY